MPRSRLIPRGRLGWLVAAVVLIAIFVHASRPHVAVPQLKGITVVAAVARLAKLGLTGVYLHSAGTACLHVVVGTRPQAGDDVARGGTVTLYVSCRTGAGR